MIFRVMAAGAGDYHTLLSIHRPLGIIILLLAIIRLANRMLTLKRTAVPTDDVATGAPHCLVVEHLFYALMIALPLVGWGVLSAGSFPIVMFGSVHLPTDPACESPPSPSCAGRTPCSPPVASPSSRTLARVVPHAGRARPDPRSNGDLADAAQIRENSLRLGRNSQHATNVINESQARWPFEVCGMTRAHEPTPFPNRQRRTARLLPRGARAIHHPKHHQ